MSKQNIPTVLRMALWRANGFKCWYCDQLIDYFDLQVDHIIAETTPAKRVEELITKLGLPSNFTLNSTLNLVPAHHRCNRKKSDIELPEQSLRHYFDLWRTKQPAVQKERERLEKQTANGKLLSLLASRIATGQLMLGEVLNAIQSSKPPHTKSSSSEPLVVCFSINVMELLESNTLPNDAPNEYPPLCDWLEKNLSDKVRTEITSPCVQTEPSGRNGETLSVRMAFWNLDVTALEKASLGDWQVLEVMPFSEIYEDGWDELFSRATVQAYHTIMQRDADRCPRCGGKGVSVRELTDYEHDEAYYIYECKECGWYDWTQ
ncbi:hypothetical protein NR798_20285 [Archangium gephyra]|uniref:hypothetical protein n=1 Tax=Archangium gephyra TaxID=48 RepID=UPI0035D3E539